MKRGWHATSRTWVGAVIVGIAAFCALFAPLLVPHDPFAQDLGKRLLVPFWMEGSDPSHLLGTDQLGRDYLSPPDLRLPHLDDDRRHASTIVSGLIGITIGVLGGFFGGRVDDVVLFAITTRLSLPVVLVALAVVGLLGSSMTILMITLGLLLWDRFAVVARSTTMQVRNLDFVAAAGAPAARASASWPARCCPTSPATSSWWRRSRSPSPSCSRRRSPSSASACRRRCRRGA